MADWALPLQQCLDDFLQQHSGSVSNVASSRCSLAAPLATAEGDPSGSTVSAPISRPRFMTAPNVTPLPPHIVGQALATLNTSPTGKSSPRSPLTCRNVSSALAVAAPITVTDSATTTATATATAAAATAAAAAAVTAATAAVTAASVTAESFATRTPSSTSPVHTGTSPPLTFSHILELPGNLPSAAAWLAPKAESPGIHPARYRVYIQDSSSESDSSDSDDSSSADVPLFDARPGRASSRPDAGGKNPVGTLVFYDLRSNTEIRPS
eukprot:TRINITY_DN4740_c0_g1_i2.p2 TRINITY_DN4740_c0_g1~~TRINITY_DN4740_c0_g1_i2.p2  ORF type:complete len:268 (+),score=66.98 TRINITY_DN4740_c0_g1_i2:336-1139(+)